MFKTTTCAEKDCGVKLDKKKATHRTKHDYYGEVKKTLYYCPAHAPAWETTRDYYQYWRTIACMEDGTLLVSEEDWRKMKAHRREEQA